MSTAHIDRPTVELISGDSSDVSASAVDMPFGRELSVRAGPNSRTGAVPPHCRPRCREDDLAASPLQAPRFVVAWDTTVVPITPASDRSVDYAPAVPCIGTVGPTLWAYCEWRNLFWLSARGSNVGEPFRLSELPFLALFLGDPT